MNRTLKNTLPFIVSLFLHVVLLLAVGFHVPRGEGDGFKKQFEDMKEGKLGGPKERTIAPKPNTEVEILGSINEFDKDSIKAELKSKAITCEANNWYGGIGIQQNFLTGVVEKVESGYPAAIAGILVGDIISDSESNDGKEITGPPGTAVIITIIRPSTGATLRFKVIRDKICLGSPT